MDLKFLLLQSVLAYCLGSIPTAVWVGRVFYGVDVRTQGSGNAGATNTIRVLGWKAGVPVLLFDAFKAWLAVQLPVFFPEVLLGDMLVNFRVLLGALAVIGHIFPVFAGFRGGKGVASITGIVVALFPGTFLVVLCSFIFLLIYSGYVSLASMISAVIFPFVAVFLFGVENPTLIIFSVLVAVAIPMSHRKNIRRLLSGTESKFSFKKKQ